MVDIPTSQIKDLPHLAAVLAAMRMPMQAADAPAGYATAGEFIGAILALGLADERIRDVIGTALQEIGGVNVVVDDAGDSIGLAISGFTPSTFAGTAYTAALADAVGYKLFTSAAPVAFTIPPHADVAFDVGSILEFEQAGAGAVTITAGAGVTLNSRDDALTTAGQHATAQVKQTAINVWTVIGDVA